MFSVGHLAWVGIVLTILQRISNWIEGCSKLNSPLFLMHKEYFAGNDEPGIHVSVDCESMLDSWMWI